MQNQLAQLLLGSTTTADQITDIGSPLRKTFPTLPFSSAALNGNNQHTFGTINQQLNALSLQLSGLNQETQNLQGANSNPAGFISKVPNEMLSQQDLFQLNQDLLNRLQQLNLGGRNGNNINNTNLQTGSSSNSGPGSVSTSSFIFTNPMNVSGHPNTFTIPSNNLQLGSSLLDSGAGNRTSLTPSPAMQDNYEQLISNSNYLEALQMQSHANNNASGEGDGGGGIIRPISQVGTLNRVDTAGKLKVIVPMTTGAGGSSGNCSPSILTTNDQSAPFQLTPVLKRPDKKVTLSSANPTCSSSQNSILRSDSNRSNPNMVTLKITDEEGHSHSPNRNTQPQSATPHFITRSTSEKVPNRSQMMQQVQRSAWARHTTK